MPDIVAVPPPQLLNVSSRSKSYASRERAAGSAARLRGHGNKIAADQAAVDAMRRELNKIPIDGTIVIGDGTTLCAKGMPGGSQPWRWRRAARC
jgi:fructose-1,6-bisphosphatase II / sedoheptulose-1,7-bisphosphatase